ncbi:Hypothetical predicted protein [Olea europaea subsp. europaea]|uniref:Protein SDA1 n=1 Tax=Olea europaea subsp. europaea TaxID=158383 RepID=A0A8S0PR94_OLEEU|nr:Hypothetical predicted protein [Olea europaea subsp. europaea]
MIATLSFLLDFEKIENDDDTDDSGSEDDLETLQTQIVVNKESIYKVGTQPTSSTLNMNPSQFDSLNRQIAAIQTQMTATLEKSKALSVSLKSFKHIPHSIDVDNFKFCPTLLKVIFRTFELHCLILLNFYPYLQNYFQSHLCDVTNLLAAVVQAYHDMY